MKMRVYQAAAKRLKIRKGGHKAKAKKKIIHITAGRDHFNARESGKVTRGKRRGRTLSESYRRSVKTMIPGI